MLSQPWSHTVVLNMGPLDWESSTLEISYLFLVNHLSFSAGRNYESDSFSDIFHVIDILLSLKYLQGLPMLFHIERAKFFKKGQFQGHLKQLTLEQNLG